MADMMRVVVGLTAWVAGTVIAVFVASFGANVVLRNAGAGQVMPVVNVLPAASATAPSPSVPPASLVPTPDQSTSIPAKPTRAPSAGAGPSRTPSASPSSAKPSATPSATAGTVRDYAMTGGRVTLQVTGNSVQLVTAVPDAGYSVQTWSGTDWLRVDFSSGSQVSSLIASWYQHAPTVTVTN